MKIRDNPRSAAAKNEQSTVRFVPLAVGALEDYSGWRKQRFGPPVKKEAAY
jgi:hypothetical protein